MTFQIKDISKPILLRQYIWDSVPEAEKSNADSMVLVSRSVNRQSVQFFHPCMIIPNLCTLEEVHSHLELELKEWKPGCYFNKNSKVKRYLAQGTGVDLWNWLERKGYVPKLNVPRLKVGDRVLTVCGLGTIANREGGRWGIKLDQNLMSSLFPDGIRYFFPSEILGKETAKSLEKCGV